MKSTQNQFQVIQQRGSTTQPQYSTKESLQNKNIEKFLNKSNRYSKESVQFLQEKNNLLLQQQQIASGNRLGSAQQFQKVDDFNLKENKFLLINNVPNEQTKHINLKEVNNEVFLHKDDQFVDLNNYATENLDEVQENEQYNISLKMNTLQKNSNQTFSINKVQFKNIIPPPLPSEVSLMAMSAQDLNQEVKQKVNTYVLSPKISARTLEHNKQGQNSIGNQTKYQQQNQHQQIQQINHKLLNNQQNLSQIKSSSRSTSPIQQLEQNCFQPQLFNPPRTPDPSDVDIIVDRVGASNINSVFNLKTTTNSTLNTQRISKENPFSTTSINNGLFGNSQNITVQSSLNTGTASTYTGAYANQSVQNLNYAMNFVNKNLEDLSKFITQMNPNTLQILDLSSNRFSVFPIEVYKMQNLKRLKLENNLIKSLPIQLFQTLRLESFSVQNNLILDIPPEICEWKGCLQHLNISRNHIHTFQKYLCYLDGLISLNISSNDFMEIPIELIFLINLKEFSTDWFKYCLPPRRPTVSGLEGQQIIKEIFTLLCLHKNQGFLNFLQFTTHFSDKNLIKISSQVKKRIQKQVQDNTGQLSYKKVLNNENLNSCNNIKASTLDNENQQNRFILNISNGNILNSTTTSFNDSFLPQESDGIQLLPEEFQRKQNMHIQGHQKIQKGRESIKLNNSSILTQNVKKNKRCSSNIQPNHILQSSSGISKTQANVQSESDFSLLEDEVLHIHNDLSFLQENKFSKNFNNAQSAHSFRGKNNSRSQTINLHQKVKSEENTNFGKILKKVEEDKKKYNDELMLKQLNMNLEIPPDQLLSVREQQFMQKQFVNEDEQEYINSHDDLDDENLLTESKDEQEQKLKSVEFLDINTQKIYTQYNQIDPKNGRNLLHLAIVDEDVSALRCLVNLNVNLINEVDFDGQSPLSLSILEEKYYSAKILIFNKADINIGGGIFGSNLTIAVIKTQYYLIRDLIRFGADINKQDNDGNGPLHYLFQSYYKNPEEYGKIAQMLLDNGANPNLENNDKWCPLHFAVKKGSLEAVEFAFLFNRVCLAKKNKRGFMMNKAGGLERLTILHIACEQNHQQIVQLLLKNNIDIFARKYDNKLPYQICQKHILVKKLVLLQQNQQIDQHLVLMRKLQLNDNQENDENINDDLEKNKLDNKKDSSFEIYQKRSRKKIFNDQKKQPSIKQSIEDNQKMMQFNQSRKNKTECGDDEDNGLVESLNSINGQIDDEDEFDQNDYDEQPYDDNDESGNYESFDEGGENLIDSADNLPVDFEDENSSPKINKKPTSKRNNQLQKSKQNIINVSSKPRMIKNGELITSNMGINEFPLFSNQLLQFQNKYGNIKEQIEHQLNESKLSLDEIEDEDLKGDAPKWFYKDHSQIPYSPNNLQKIQGMNQIISQIIHQNTGKQKKQSHDYKKQNDSFLISTGIKTPEFSEGKIQFFPINQYPQFDRNHKVNTLINSNNTQRHLTHKQIQQQNSIKSQTIQASNFFSNLKNYKQVIKSASNINEYKVKILDQELSLTTRLYFLTQLKLIQFKLLQILKLITRQNIYQLFCRSGIIEDFLKLGDDNLNTLINTNKRFNSNIIQIYKMLSDSPSFDNNSMTIQIVNLFGDTCYNLFVLFNNKQMNTKQAPITSQTALVNTQLDLPFQGRDKDNNTSGCSAIKTETNNKNSNQDAIKKENDSPAKQFKERMKINYSTNIMKDFLELQQSSKIKKDNFTKQTLITDQDVDRMMPAEEEHEIENEEITKVLQNYAHMKLKNNPLQDIPKLNKIFK